MTAVPILMLPERQTFVQQEIADGTGAGIEVCEEISGTQKGLKLWFSDLSRSRGPVVVLKPAGLTRYKAELTFGSFAGDTVAHMQKAGAEEWILARALIQYVALTAEVRINDAPPDPDWVITGPDFRLVAEKRGIQDRESDDALVRICHDLVIPLMGAMAELCGYDVVEEVVSEAIGLMEGAVELVTIRRRERNPRNRLLCLRIHGKQCALCLLEPTSTYGSAGHILEAHHLQPLSLCNEAREYNPAHDLVPLCPNCHRAVHTRRPVPWTLNELRGVMDGTNG